MLNHMELGEKYYKLYIDDELKVKGTLEECELMLVDSIKQFSKCRYEIVNRGRTTLVTFEHGKET